MSAEQTLLERPRRVRSGSHLKLRGKVYYYRRAVPIEHRAYFGCTEVGLSLDTSDLGEAKRLEKQHDVEFEARLRDAISATNPRDIAERINAFITTNGKSVRGGLGITGALHGSRLRGNDVRIARNLVGEHLGQVHAYRAEFERLLADIGEILPTTPLDPSVWQQCRDGILSVARYQVGKAVGKPATENAPAHTLDWAYDHWLRLKNRPQQTNDEARSHLNAFGANAKIIFLSEVKRKHLVEWRDRLSDAAELSPGSVNQRLTLVSAILRAGWRDAEMPEPNLKAITVPDTDDSNRVAWSRGEILTALQNLQPHSWAAWIFVIGLTTGVRLGEPMAAEVSWYDSAGFIHVRSRSSTKARKLHLLPIIECLRGPLAAYLGERTDGYLFADAPRPNNPRLKVSHEASKWFGRFFRRHKIDRVIHELRHTWVEEARHSPIPKDIWEIISGHSRLTISDRYGGQKPDVLADANEVVCKFLTGDPELKAAMLRLVGYI